MQTVSGSQVYSLRESCVALKRVPPSGWKVTQRTAVASSGEQEIGWSCSRSQNRMVRSALPVARTNSFGWKRTALTAAVWREKSANIFPATRSHSCLGRGGEGRRVERRRGEGRRGEGRRGKRGERKREEGKGGKERGEEGRREGWGGEGKREERREEGKGGKERGEEGSRREGGEERVGEEREGEERGRKGRREEGRRGEGRRGMTMASGETPEVGVLPTLTVESPLAETTHRPSGLNCRLLTASV